jgi:photosystem II stability/assembly factor-like uncharacterized protein
MNNSLLRKLFLFIVISAIFAAYLAIIATDSTKAAEKTYAGWAVGETSGGYGTIQYSQDSGATWTRQGSPANIPNVHLQGVATVDENTCWVTGEPADGYGTILRTEDGGATWTRQGSPATIPNVTMAKIYILDRNTAWVVGNPGVVLFANDGGQTWQNKTTADVPNVLLQGVFAIDVNNVWATGYMAGGRDTILRTSDGGATWVNKGAPHDSRSKYLLDVSAPSGDVAWACGNGYMVIRTLDNGLNWSKSFPAGGEYDANSIHGFDADNAWVATDGDGIYRTYDGGQTWNEQHPKRENSYLMCINALDTDTAWVCGLGLGGVIHHTSDGGQVWHEQLVSGAGFSGISMVAVEKPLPYTGR